MIRQSNSNSYSDKHASKIRRNTDNRSPASGTTRCPTRGPQEQQEWVLSESESRSQVVLPVLLDDLTEYFFTERSDIMKTYLVGYLSGPRLTQSRRGLQRRLSCQRRRLTGEASRCSRRPGQKNRPPLAQTTQKAVSRLHPTSTGAISSIFGKTTAVLKF